MRRAALVAAGAATLLSAAPAAAAPVRVAPGELYALAAYRGQAYGVVDAGTGSRPLTLVRSTGRSAGSRTSFGVVGAERPDVAAGSAGVTVSWGRLASGGEAWYMAPATRPRAEEYVASATGPGRLVLDGRTPLLAGPDLLGNAFVARPVPTGEALRTVLTTSAPHERHFPVDAAMLGSEPLVLNLLQRRDLSVLQVLGVGAPTAPLVRVGRLETILGSIAVSGRTVRVAYMRGGRAYLASASAGARRWSQRRLRGPGGGRGGASVTAAGQVAYTQRGAGGRDVYLWDGRLRRLTRTPTDEHEPQLAADGRRLFAAWTRTTPRGSRPEAMIERVR